VTRGWTRRATLRRLGALASLAAASSAGLRAGFASAAEPLAAPSVAPAAAPPVAPLVAPVRALVGGRVIDGTGGPPIDDAAVVIENERIVAVGPMASMTIPDGAEITSTEGMTVLPGLIDLQVRLSRLGHGDVRRWDEAYVPLAERVVMPAAAKLLLLAGVTTARDVESPLDAALSVRDRIRDKRIPGPTLFVSGPVLETNAPSSAREYRWSVTSVADAKQKAERVARSGVDYVIVADADRFAADELQAIVATVKAAGRPVYAEVRRDTDVAPALAAGVDGLLGFGNGTMDTWPDAALQQLRARAARNEPVTWTACVSALTNFEWLRQNREPLDDLRWADGLPPIVAHDLRASIANPGMLTWFEMPAVRRPLVGPRLRSALGAGARVLVGSDAGVPAHLPSRATWQEIEALVLDGGMAPMDAIVAATSGAAAVLGVQHETGSLLPGKYADVIVVRGDPLRHVERLQDVQIVIRRGQRWR
jgi:imidazolonepropionase-like amidohydrolase